MSPSHFGFRTNEEISAPSFMFFPRSKVSYTFFHPSIRWIIGKILLNKSWIVRWRQRIKWNYCTVIRGFTWEIKIVNAQTLWNYNVSNNYLQKLVLYYFRGGGEKSFSKNFYKFKKHETGGRFLANLHNKNRFPSRKKLSRN